MIEMEDRSTADGDLAVTEIQPGTYHTRHDMSDDQLSLTLALALAEVDSSPATELIDNLSSYVDPDALDRLFRTRPTGDSRGPGRVVLEIAGYTVTVQSDGEIVISE